MKIELKKFMVADPPEGGGGDPELKTVADVLKELGEIKTGLEKKSKEDAKAEATEIIEEKMAEVNKKIDEIKGLPPEVTAEQLKQAMEDLKVTMKVCDRIQINFKNTGKSHNNEIKSFDEKLKEVVEENTDTINKFKKGELKKFAIEIDMKAVGAVSTSNVTGTTNYGAQRRAGIIMRPDTMQHIRDLVPVVNAGPGTDYYFMRENGAGEGSIAATAETTAAASPTTQATGLKPQFDIDLVESSVKFEYIAGWMLMSRKAMNNIPGFSSFLQRRLPVKLMDAEDAYLLYGTGTSPEIKGILASGNYQNSTATGTSLVSRIIDDMSLLEDTYKRMSSGIALRPKSWYEILGNQASGSGEFDLPPGVSFVNGVLSLFGVPVIKTTALHAGDYVVGDFQNGAELLVQEAMRIEFFEQDNTNVRSNQITVRIEESVAFPVYGDDFFIKGATPSGS